MIVRRLVAGMGVALAATAVLATPAVAGGYPFTTGDATVSATTVAPGGTVTVSGDGFEPGCSVQFSATQGGDSSAEGQVLTADEDGNVSTTVKLTESGTNVLTLSGCDRVLTAQVTVTAGAAAGGLPGTGGDLTSLWAGVGLLLAGSLMVAVSRSRRKITV